MKNLIQNVLEIEDTANAAIERARLEAKSISSHVQTELENYRRELERVFEQRIEAHRREAEERYQSALAAEQAAHAEALAALGGIGPHLIQKQAGTVSARYREL